MSLDSWFNVLQSAIAIFLLYDQLTCPHLYGGSCIFISINLKDSFWHLIANNSHLHIIFQLFKVIDFKYAEKNRMYDISIIELQLVANLVFPIFSFSLHPLLWSKSQILSNFNWNGNEIIKNMSQLAWCVRQ